MRLPRWEGGTAYWPCWSALSIAGILIGLSSCASIGPRILSPTRESIPANRDPAEWVRDLTQRIHQFHSLRSLAKVYYWNQDEGGGFRGSVLVRRPDRLRLETLSPFGAVLIVTADASQVSGLHLREGVLYRGKSSKENLLRYTQIPLGLGELTSLLMGLPPVNVRRPWKGEGATVRWSLPGGGSEAVTFDPASGVAIGWTRTNPDGATGLSATFADFLPTPAGLFPRRISLECNAEERRLEIRYQEPELNAALPASLFVQPTPAHVREVPLESLGRPDTCSALAEPKV